MIVIGKASAKTKGGVPATIIETNPSRPLIFAIYL